MKSGPSSAETGPVPVKGGPSLAETGQGPAKSRPGSLMRA